MLSPISPTVPVSQPVSSTPAAAAPSGAPTPGTAASKDSVTLSPAAVQASAHDGDGDGH